MNQGTGSDYNMISTLVRTKDKILGDHENTEQILEELQCTEGQTEIKSGRLDRLIPEPGYQHCFVTNWKLKSPKF